MCSETESKQPTALPRRTAMLGALAGAGALAALAGATPASAAVTTPTPGTPPTGNAVICLGVQAGPPPRPNRIGFATLLQVNGALYLIDAGRGSLTQFANMGFSFTNMKSMFITHLHNDHIFDYYNFFASSGDPAVFPPRSAPVSVFGPGPAGGLPPSRVGQTPFTIGSNPTPGIVELTNSMYDAYAYSANILNRDQGSYDPRSLMDVAAIKLPDVGSSYQNTAPPMDPFVVTSDENLTVSAILVPHFDTYPSFAFRFDVKGGKSFVFSGDCTKSDNVVKIAQGVDILMHESIYELNTVYHQNSHTSAVQVGEVAAAANAKSLIVSHYTNSVTDAQWRAAIAQNYQGPTSIALDGQVYPL